MRPYMEDNNRNKNTGTTTTIKILEQQQQTKFMDECASQMEGRMQCNRKQPIAINHTRFTTFLAQIRCDVQEYAGIVLTVLK